MGADFDKLATILTAEREDGCRDRIVIGGLDKFLDTWLREAQSSVLHPASRAGQAQTLPISEIMDPLRGYAQKPVTERVVAIAAAMRALQDVPKDHLGANGAETRSEDRLSKRRRAEGPAPSVRSPVTAVRGINTAQARKLESLGVRTVEDLLYLFPHRYDDFSHLKTIQELRYGEEVTIIGVVQEVQNRQTRRGMELTKAVLADGTGSIEATWFNQPYLVRQLARGRRVVLSGRVDQYLGRLTFQSPQWEPWTGDLVHTGRLVPVYPLTEGLTARSLRSLMKGAIEEWAPRLTDALPNSLRQNYELEDVVTAIRQMHFPNDTDSLGRARHRLCFEEFLLIQLGVLGQRFRWQQESGRPLVVDGATLDTIISALPFTLTSAQQRVLGDITADLQRSYPMSRLLQGEVGSGKTVVALLAMLIAVANGMQAVMMAPTEVLAEQHYRTLTSTLQGITERLRTAGAAAADWVGRTQVGLLRGSLTVAEKEERRDQIASGQVNIIVGTHALIQEGATFQDLGLAIVDEQHRFGVSQRAALRQKGYHPHVLVMSATPIPRTLALTLYGDLDLSIIDELPPHRQKIITKWLAPVERERAYAFVRGQVESGRQAFIICPLIEESEKIEAKAAVSEYARLQDQVFPELQLGLLHGRMKSADKEEVMARFREGEYHVLVSTPVVEVGIDVPNATVMLVEGADRFGLAQLHQFRGRVGRGEHQSYCLLLADSPSFEGEQRLRVIETTGDGFLLAEEDLKMRGPGEFFGTRQSGLPDLKVAQIGDTRVLEQARRAAQDLFERDPALAQPEHLALAARVQEFWATATDLS
jgi:ATP-dependent DNA helicase RecG